jgi:hypothetical protein
VSWIASWHSNDTSLMMTWWRHAPSIFNFVRHSSDQRISHQWQNSVLSARSSTVVIYGTCTEPEKHQNDFFAKIRPWHNDALYSLFCHSVTLLNYIGLVFTKFCTQERTHAIESTQERTYAAIDVKGALFATVPADPRHLVATCFVGKGKGGTNCTTATRYCCHNLVWHSPSSWLNTKTWRKNG